MLDSFSVPVIVTKVLEGTPGTMVWLPEAKAPVQLLYTAHIAGNFNFHIKGISKQDVLNQIKETIVSYLRPERESVELVNLTIDELIVEQVHEF